MPNSMTVFPSLMPTMIRMMNELVTDSLKSWQCAETEADARAKLLIYLLENGLCQV